MHGIDSREDMASKNVVDYSDPYVVSNLFQDGGKYGSVTKDYEALQTQRKQVLGYLSFQPPFSGPCLGPQKLSQSYVVTQSEPSPGSKEMKDVIDLDEPQESKNKMGADTMSVIVVDSDDEDGSQQVQKQPSFHDFRAWLNSQMAERLRKNKSPLVASDSILPLSCVPGNAIEAKKLPSIQYEKVVLHNAAEKHLASKLENRQYLTTRKREGASIENIEKNQRVKFARDGREDDALATQVTGDKGIIVSSPLISSEDHYYTPTIMTHHDDTETLESDGLEDIWKDMSMATEFSKDAMPTDESNLVQEEEDDCAHSFMLEDDLGLVCRVCGVIRKRIDTIFDYQWMKGTRSTRTYMPGSRNSNLGDIAETSGKDITEHLLLAADISIHPRHMKQMKPHQIEGFNFLVKNLLGDPPGGCILAHAPGSGKTFMLISFIQSFMAKDLHARPLVVLPKGILSTWRKEFQRWQVEDIPLYDFYSSKADSRLQQLEMLNKWQENRSILLLGYKQFANIICEGGSNKVTAACQEKLLKIPTLLILDEGHTPRNDNTDMVDSLAKVRTPCKVVLSGTLFQNHVGEVFNILKLVRPNFMKTEKSRAIVKRILSRVHISGGRKPTKGNHESYFCELVEETLRSDENYKRKIAVIQELRDMTRDVLHYYKGDFLDELPGLIDFTVLLKLGSKQKDIIRKLGKLDKFKKSSLEKAIYIHPQLMELRENDNGDKDNGINIQKVDAIIESINIADGAKAKFFLNLLAMAERSGERMLVFSQYLLPLKFLERLVISLKGWRSGKEIFVIFGDSSPEDRERSMDQFNNSSDAKIFFGSIKACGEGVSLVGASRVVILDVHLNPSVTRQAIGRAFRPGQEKKVYIYRLVAAESHEEDDHNTSFRKELISKLWFEWSEHFGQFNFELDAIDIEDSQDVFFDYPVLRENIKALYRR